MKVRPKFNTTKLNIIRYLCPPEATHGLLEYKMSELSHVTYRLPVRNKDEQNIYFKENCEEEFINKNAGTALTTRFELTRGGQGSGSRI